MSVAFKAFEAASREPCHAYVSDQHSLDTLRAVMEELSWPVEKVQGGGLRGAVQTLSVAASPNILFVDLSETADPLNDLNSLAEVCEPGTLVIAIGAVNDVRLYRDLIAGGIQDYLLKPLNPDHVRDAIGVAQAVLHAPRADALPERPRLTLSVVGARGGAGATMVATSLSWHMSEAEKRTTALLDLDVHFGTGALSLDLEPGRGLTDAIENPGRIDGLFIERAAVRAGERLSILSAEAPVGQPVVTDGAAFHHLQAELRGAFDCTVVDVPRGVMIQHPHLLHDTTVLALVTEFTLASARDAIRLLAWFRTSAPQARILVIANKVQAGAQELSRKDFEQSIERKVDVVLPFDTKATVLAAQKGKTVGDAARATKLGQALAQAGRLVLGEAELKAEGGAPSLVGRIAEIGKRLPGRGRAAAGESGGR
ncbi:MAG: pilus assembly protein CpaE [Sphingobium sp.]